MKKYYREIVPKNRFVEIEFEDDKTLGRLGIEVLDSRLGLSVFITKIELKSARRLHKAVRIYQMTNRLIINLSAFVCFVIASASCNRGERQAITLRNLSPENIYFIVSENNVLSDPNEVAKVRPLMVQDKEVANDIRDYSHRYQIERDSLGTIITSGSAEIFVNIVPIQSVIKDRYNGRLNIFVITENELFNHADQDIVDKKLFKHFKTVTAEQMKKDTLALVYR